ncbi:HotDog domain-containing protein [Lentinula aciculospora]|uniref:HotDog domain-containing protein n=1 Tax=Lentinula aciculospora TaxID=153920 RepID=A0A9W9AC46_9AGAR|nr:HotDog domain-containing protein [Lentinula aciculospora]
MSSAIVGNGSEEVKAHLQDIPNLLINGRQNSFAASVITRLNLAEVSIKSNAIEPHRKEGLVVYTIVVEEDMVNGGGNIHGGCSAFLVDVCSTACIMALKIQQGVSALDVSQSLNIVYHAPAAIGEILRIVNTTMTVGRRVASARTEIWSENHHRLVATGVHIKMEPSSTKL